MKNNVSSNLLPGSRRNFLRKTGAVTCGFLSAGGVWSELASAKSRSPNEKLQIACIGTANRGAVNIAELRGESIVALCDIDEGHIKRAKEELPNVRSYADYRQLIEQEAHRIDAVVVSTADHHHAHATLQAIRAGLHVYCEKPLTHTIQEARLVAEAARSHGVATQMGIQYHATDLYRQIVDVIRSRAIGDVTEAHVWMARSWGGGKPPQQTQEPPASLNWDLWLGPAAIRPFAPGRYHPAQWRRWWDFGNGTLGDMGCHFIDLPYWALNLRHPISCRAEGVKEHPETCPTGLTVTYEFPQRGKYPPVKLIWYDGINNPSSVGGVRVPGAGIMFSGSEGKLFVDTKGYRLLPEERFLDFQPPPQTTPESIGHHAEWIKGCKEGTPTSCNFDYSGALTELVLLGNVAFQCGQEIKWDAENLRATNCPLAEQFIRKQYRPGWEIS